MSFRSDLYSRLSGYSGLAALVADRIYPVKASQTTDTPYCAYQIIDRKRIYSHQGFTGLERYRVQISCVGNDPDAARAVVEQVIAAMEGWPVVNNRVQSCFHDDDFDDFDEETKALMVPVDFLIQYG